LELHRLDCLASHGDLSNWEFCKQKLAELEPEGDGTLVRMRVSSLDWTAGVLAGLGCSFTIRRPDELRTSVRALSARLAEAGDSRSVSSSDQREG